MSKTVFSFKNRVIHSPALWESSSASEIHCGSSADDYRGQLMLGEIGCGESIIWVSEPDHTSLLLNQTKWGVQLGSRRAERKEGKLAGGSGGRMR